MFRREFCTYDYQPTLPKMAANFEILETACFQSFLSFYFLVEIALLDYNILPLQFHILNDNFPFPF